jgi:4-hydroxy-4-methyl-2-oxoglutarate aldolase
VKTAVSPEVVAALARYDTPTLSNAIETFDVRPRDEGYMTCEVRCMFPEMKPVVGFAATATVRTHEPPLTHIEQVVVWRHVQSLPAPRLLVVQDLDDPPGHGAQFGEVQGAIFKALGCVAIVTDGTVRDLEEVRATGLQMFAAGTVASHAYAHFESAGVTVDVGGLVVGPGDILHADRHGVLQIPAEIAERLPEAADRIIAREQKLIGWIRSPEFDPDRLEEMRRVEH